MQRIVKNNMVLWRVTLVSRRISLLVAYILIRFVALDAETARPKRRQQRDAYVVPENENESDDVQASEDSEGKKGKKGKTIIGTENMRWKGQPPKDSNIDKDTESIEAFLMENTGPFPTILRPEERKKLKEKETEVESEDNDDTGRDVDISQVDHFKALVEPKGKLECSCAVLHLFMD